MPNPPEEVILEIGAECGSLAIVGICDPERGWRFMAARDETALQDMLPEEEQEGLEFHEKSGTVGSLAAALGLLDRYPWHKLYPLQVHSEFRRAIFDAVISRYQSEGTSATRAACHCASPTSRKSSASGSSSSGWRGRIERNTR